MEVFERTRAAYFSRQLDKVTDLSSLIPFQGRLIFSKALTVNARGDILISAYKLDSVSSAPPLIGLYLLSNERLLKVVSLSTAIKEILPVGSCALNTERTIIGNVIATTDAGDITKPFVFEKSRGLIFLENLVDPVDVSTISLGRAACVNNGRTILLSNGYLLRKNF